MVWLRKTHANGYGILLGDKRLPGLGYSWGRCFGDVSKGRLVAADTNLPRLSLAR